MEVYFFQDYTRTLSNILKRDDVSLQPVSLAIEELIAAAKEIQEEVKVRRNESIFHGDYGIVHHASLTFF